MEPGTPIPILNWLQKLDLIQFSIIENETEVHNSNRPN
jgi:hypothetical protein